VNEISELSLQKFFTRQFTVSMKEYSKSSSRTCELFKIVVAQLVNLFLRNYYKV